MAQANREHQLHCLMKEKKLFRWGCLGMLLQQTYISPPESSKNSSFLNLRAMKLRIYHLLYSVLAFTGCFPTVKVAGQFSDQEFNQMAEQMAEGKVPEITPDALRPSYYLLDTRERAEFDVSHLKDARWVGYSGFDLKSVADLPKDATIVVYCSVGYRSERIGEKLQKAGFQQVKNLKGGIFGWVNLGKPVVNNDEEPIETVHGYDEKWAKWVKRGKTIW